MIKFLQASGMLLLAVCLQAQGKPRYGSLTVSKVINVYDEDTFRVDIDKLHPNSGKEYSS